MSRKCSASFLEVYESYGGEVVFHEEVEPGMQDFKTLIVKLDSLDVEIVWPHLAPEDRIEFYRQFGEVGAFRLAAM